MVSILSTGDISFGASQRSHCLPYYSRSTQLYCMGMNIHFISSCLSDLYRTPPSPSLLSCSLCLSLFLYLPVSSSFPANSNHPRQDTVSSLKQSVRCLIKRMLGLITQHTETSCSRSKQSLRKNRKIPLFLSDRKPQRCLAIYARLAKFCVGRQN